MLLRHHAAGPFQSSNRCYTLRDDTKPLPPDSPASSSESPFASKTDLYVALSVLFSDSFLTRLPGNSGLTRPLTLTVPIPPKLVVHERQPCQRRLPPLTLKPCVRDNALQFSRDSGVDDRKRCHFKLQNVLLMMGCTQKRENNGRATAIHRLHLAEKAHVDCFRVFEGRKGSAERPD